MSKKNSRDNCSFCGSTGISKATLINQEVDGVLYKDHVAVVLCGQHEDVALSERNIAAIERSSGLPVNIVGVSKQDNQ